LRRRCYGRSLLNCTSFRRSVASVSLTPDPENAETDAGNADIRKQRETLAGRRCQENRH
jgi:hypothetical protein